MNQEEKDDKNEREQRYVGSQDDVRIIRRELNKLTEEVGKQRDDVKEMIGAMKGDGYRSEGIFQRQEMIEASIVEIKNRLGELEIKASKRAIQLNIIMLMIGGFIGIFLKWAFDQLSIKGGK